jgi:hypothetical protein
MWGAEGRSGGAAPHRSAPRRSAFRDEGGGAAVAFALLLPLLLGISLGIVETAGLLLDYHRAGEATRRAARAAVIGQPVANLSALAAGRTVACTGGASVTCTGGAVTNAAAFAAILAEMRAIHPGITGERVTIEYRPSGIGDPSSPGGLLPLVGVRLSGLRHGFSAFGVVPGLPAAVTLPDFATSTLGHGV